MKVLSKMKPNLKERRLAVCSTVPGRKDIRLAAARTVLLNRKERVTVRHKLSGVCPRHRVQTAP